MSGLLSTLADTARHVRRPEAIGLLTGVVVVDETGATVLTLRSKVAPMHLVMATYALAGETEDAIRRAGGDHNRQLAALAVARHALKQAME